MSSLERAAVQRLIDKATAAGVDVPPEVTGILGTLGCSSYAARTWAAEHPDDEPLPCCDGSVWDAELCTCWEPVYDVEQQPCQPITGPAELLPRHRMCSDCAFRPGSPERTDGYTEEMLLELPVTGEAFWCHDGMRRPAHWRHPDGRTVPGSPDDWQPARIGAIPYRADGRPGLLCAGWAALAAKAVDAR